MERRAAGGARYATREEIERLLDETERYEHVGAFAKRRLERQSKQRTPAQKVRHAIFSMLYYILIAILCGMLYIGVRAKMSDAIPTVLGYSVFTVKTGSMVPTLPIGCYIVVHHTEDTAALEAGTVTTFRFEDGTVVTHRIIEVLDTDDGVRYRTKGDNPENDPDAELLSPDRVIGTLVFVIRLPEIW
ncbi:MAG TPA: signal peptidase I [Eubacteriales bacterium]|nr:signal peptidase I [Eubacteriales bacterium]